MRKQKYCVLVRAVNVKGPS